MATVGESWAILKGRMSGNRQKAMELLKSKPYDQLEVQNKQEGRVRARLRASPVSIGSRPRTRRAI